MRSVRSDGRDVRRNSGRMTDSILRENQVLAVRRPVLLDRDTETEGGKLEWVAAIDVRDDERRSEILSVKSDESLVSRRWEKHSGRRLQQEPGSVADRCR